MKRALPFLVIAAAVATIAFLLLRPRPDPDTLRGPPETAAPPPVVAAGTPGASTDAKPPPTPRRRKHRHHRRTAQPPTPPTGDGASPGQAPAAAGEDEPAPPREPTVWPTSADGIKGAMKEALPGIKRCYEQALAQDPTMAGTIAVTFTIGTTDTAPGLGQVLEAGIQEATIQQTTMDGCLLDAMEALQFDPPVDGETEVIYPFVFSQG